MKCEQAIKVMQEYVDGLLSPVVSVELEDHVAECTGCSAELSALLRLCKSVSSLPDAEPHFDMVSTVRERIADLPRESFAWQVLPRRERPRVWVVAVLLWVGVVAAWLLNFWPGVSAIGSKIANGLLSAGQSVWAFASGAAGDVYSLLAPVGRAAYSTVTDLLAGAGTAQMLIYVAGFLLACFVVVAADRAKRLRVAAGTIQLLG